MGLGYTIYLGSEYEATMMAEAGELIANAKEDGISVGINIPGGKCADIAAASIIAKVTRDRLMYELDKEYPGYGFAKHKGYGTAAHYAAIRELGPCPAHRPSFLRKMH